MVTLRLKPLVSPIERSARDGVPRCVSTPPMTLLQPVFPLKLECSVSRTCISASCIGQTSLVMDEIMYCCLRVTALTAAPDVLTITLAVAERTNTPESTKCLTYH